ncbi:hypothetical protein NARC_40250 [Candidatus Nitrosocosmicus arcticus]|uniref:Uncharacterized protein n=1 Tax=Candidatus Nitrosocosmicus arcticus TaxID=2035267 RepID=A0A557SXF3_9ARCH|nr:hypothetical protein NARC_40250 [Candidatus Nitrosocosmicus arcticus]
MFSSNKRYKQILVDIDNYNASREIGHMGDSFNQVLPKLINRFKRGKL